MKKDRFFIKTKVNDDKAYAEAIKFATTLAEKDKSISKIILLIGTKSNTGWFERLFGIQTVKHLFQGVKDKNNSYIIKFETKKTYKNSYNNSEIVITCALDSADVLKIDDYNSVKVIIAIPWLPERLEKWVNTWNPTELRTMQPAFQNFTELSCIAQEAMQNLTASINMSTGIHHPLDNQRAKTVILALHKYENYIDADLIGSYLLRELNWEYENVKEIEDLINTMNKGKYFKGGKRTGLKNLYKILENDCESIK